MDDALRSRIAEARAFLDGRVVRTPVEHSPGLSERMGVRVHLKLESLQVTGSFKLRGAWFAIHRLGNQAARGVATCSAGNHGLGVAYAARESGIPARVFVPASVDASKLSGLKALGAEVIGSPFEGFDDTEEWALGEARADALPWVSAYDDESVMAGNGGSLGIEILDQVPGARTIVVPVGGGGMAAGLSVPFRDRVPGGNLVAAQLASSAALMKSLEAGHAVTRMPSVATLAGGLEGGLGRIPFPLLQRNVSQVVAADEAAVWDAVRWMLREHRLLVEPSAAVAVAACLSGSVRAEGQTVVVVSGRNVSIQSVRRILNENPDGTPRD
jgi:threonine dehydratase